MTQGGTPRGGATLLGALRGKASHRFATFTNLLWHRRAALCSARHCVARHRDSGPRFAPLGSARPRNASQGLSIFLSPRRCAARSRAAPRAAGCRNATQGYRIYHGGTGLRAASFGGAARRYASLRLSTQGLRILFPAAFRMAARLGATLRPTPLGIASLRTATFKHLPGHAARGDAALRRASHCNSTQGSQIFWAARRYAALRFAR